MTSDARTIVATTISGSVAFVRRTLVANECCAKLVIVLLLLFDFFLVLAGPRVTAVRPWPRSRRRCLSCRHIRQRLLRYCSFDRVELRRAVRKVNRRW